MNKDVPVTYTDQNGKEISLGGAIGFRGFPSKKGIGGLQTVCGPWNQDSYTENWRWLRKHGPVWAATAFGFQASSFRHKLYEALTRESFALKATPLRPTPMKLCPPNHMLHGIELNMDNKVVRGVQALDCVAVHPSVSDRSAFRAPLRAPYDNNLGAIDGMQQGYTLNGEVYDLTQYIGYPPMPDDTNGQLVSCKEPSYIVNSVTTAWTDGELTGVWLHCIPPPS